jgi:hypothetical protein
MRCRSEPIKTDRRALPGPPVASPADQSGAKPWSYFRILACLAKPKAKARVSDDMGRETAIPRITGERRVIAQVFSVAAAVWTDSAGGSQPWHPDPVSDGKSAHTGSQRPHMPDNLMAGHNWQHRI